MVAFYLPQFYPFPENALAREVARFPNAEIVWCQEEPKNQGAWTFVAPLIHESVRETRRGAWPRYIGRPEYASTAAGLHSQHDAELHAFLDAALAL